MSYTVVAKEKFATRNSIGTGADQAIVHGLGTTPNLVDIIPIVTGAVISNRYADTTNIHVTITSGKAFKWIAAVI